LLPDHNHDRRWVFGYAVVVLLITSIPYWIAFGRAGEDWHFTGFVFGVEDGNSYIAKMLSGAAGEWLFRTPYSAVEQNGFLAFLPYILLGKLTSQPAQHEQLVVLFHIFRLAAGFCLIFATYHFVSLFLEQVFWRRLALVVITVGGGIGWLVLLFSNGSGSVRLPLDFYSPETFGFLALFGIPHLAAARALLLWGLVYYLQPFEKVGFTKMPAAGTTAWMMLGLFQPLTVVVGWAIIIAHLVIFGVLRWQRNRETGLHEWGDWARYAQKSVGIGLISLPIVIYTVVSFWVDPYLRGWSAQNIIQSPPPVDYLLAYGMFLPFSVLSIRPLINRFPLKGPLLVGWLIILPVLAYAPYNLQRRLPEGGWVAIVILGVFLLSRWQRHGHTIARFILVLSLIPTTVMIGGSIVSTQVGEPVFQPAERVAAFKYLAQYARPGDIVLASYQISNALPAWAPVRVVIGHGPESVGLSELKPLVDRFYSVDSSDAERMELLHNNRVRFVIFSEVEKPQDDHLESWNLSSAKFLRLVYDDSGYKIYEVQVASND